MFKIYKKINFVKFVNNNLMIKMNFMLKILICIVKNVLEIKYLGAQNALNFNIHSIMIKVKP